VSFIDTLWANTVLVGGDDLVVEVAPPDLRPTSGHALRQLAQRLRGWLESEGVAPGDRVGLVAPNSARWVAADLAILAHGAVCVPLYARQDPRELVTMLQDCGARCALVHDADMAMKLRECGFEAKTYTFDEALVSAPSEAPVVPRTPDDPVTLIYTSGTSGEAKGVITTVANVDMMLEVTAGKLAALGCAGEGADRVFHYLPTCFAGSRIILWTTLLRRNAIHLSTDLDRLIDEIPLAAPGYFLNVPVLLERIRTGADAALRKRAAPIAALYKASLRAHARVEAAAEARPPSRPRRRDRALLTLADRLLFSRIRDRLGLNLRFLICGSAPLAPETQRWFNMIGLQVYQVYGLTETTAIVTMDDPNHVVPGRVGVAIPGCELKLGEGDELLVRGPNVFPGYWGRPEATAAAFEDGWFRTGDQCTLDAHGNLAVIGRVKNLLVPSSGHNVAPEPIESKLLTRIPGAAQVVLLGHGRPYLTALITGPAAPADVDAALSAVNADLPHYKRVRRWHHRAEPLTPEEGLLTANGKLKRAAIESAFASEIEGMYA
jgi:long-chain acyl-CoA synthetase